MGRKQIYALATAALVLFGAGTAIYAFKNVLLEDHTPPEITIDQECLELSVEDSRDVLLQGVTAEDARDGDVTDRLVIESISNITSESTATVTYAAFDRSGNVAKATRTMLLRDYEPPRFGQRQALVIPEGGNQDVLAFMSATDVIDGDISGHMKGNLISNTTSLSKAGAHQVEFRVTNSLGDTARITLPVDVYPATAYNASVMLREYLVYLPKGTQFHGEDYLESVDIGSMSYSLTENNPDIQIFINSQDAGTAMHVVRVDMNDNVNTAVPGIYSVTYSVNMDEQYTGFTRLNVIVEE